MQKINELKNFEGLATLTSQSNKVKVAIDGLGKSEALLALMQSDLSEENKKAIAIKLKLASAEYFDKAATDADTASKYANLKVTNLLKVAWSKFTAFAMANPWLVAIGATVLAIAGITKVVDALTVSTEEHKEQLDTLKSEYSEIASELSSLNDELKTTQERISELEGNDTLTFTEKEEYDNLVKQNNELQRRIDLLELEEKQKNKERNKAFVDTMNSDTQDKYEYHKNDGTGNISKGNASFVSVLSGSSGTTYSMADEEEYLNQQFEEREKNLLRIAEIEEQLKTDINNEALKNEKTRLETYNEQIDSYLESKNTEWSGIASEISYISNPTTEDEENVNKWLDFIADFQDKMAIMQGGTNAKENTFNRLVDNWQFDETMQELQDLGEQGKVTADMLNNPKYDEFIQKLVELGVIDSADNLEDIALAFNKVAEASENANETGISKRNIEH